MNNNGLSSLAVYVEGQMTRVVAIILKVYC